MAEKEFRHLVRIASADLKGEKVIAYALRNIKGVNFQFANAICSLAKIEKTKRVGDLTDEEIKRLDEVIKSPLEQGVPVWMVNRRRDPEDNQNKHIVTTDLMFTKDSDLKQMKKIRSYKGVRHMQGLPVRGQKTKANFRKSKGRVVGVRKKAGAKSGKT